MAKLQPDTIQTHNPENRCALVGKVTECIWLVLTDLYGGYADHNQGVDSKSRLNAQ